MVMRTEICIQTFMYAHNYTYTHILKIYVLLHTYIGGLIGETGLPFHIEGPFLQNIGVRHLPLPVSSDSVFGGIGIGQEGGNGKGTIDLSPYLQAMAQRMGRKVIICIYVYRYIHMYVVNTCVYAYVYFVIYS
jgi:hypothetical protein